MVAHLAGRSSRGGKPLLTAQLQLLDDFLIFLQVVTLQVIKKLSSFAGHFDKAVPGVVILAMGTQVFGQM